MIEVKVVFKDRTLINTQVTDVGWEELNQNVLSLFNDELDERILIPVQNVNYIRVKNMV